MDTTDRYYVRTLRISHARGALDWQAIDLVDAMAVYRHDLSLDDVVVAELYETEPGGGEMSLRHQAVRSTDGQMKETALDLAYPMTEGFFARDKLAEFGVRMQD